MACMRCRREEPAGCVVCPECERALFVCRCPGCGSAQFHKGFCDLCSQESVDVDDDDDEDEEWRDSDEDGDDGDFF